MTIDDLRFTIRAILMIAVFFTLAVSCQKDPKFSQYYIEGEQLYLKNCSNCHQKNGAGLGLVYPPIAQSDFMDENLDEVLCLIRKGRKGEMTVNQNVYNQPMPGIPSLTDLEIAEIATYIYNTWGRQRGLIEIKQVGVAMETCPGD